VSEVYRNQSELLENVYQLNLVLTDANLSVDENLRKAALNRLDGIARSEGAIYDRLSEALPRRYWSRDGEVADASLEDPRREVAALIADALALEENLTDLLNVPAGTVDIESAMSPGELLARIQSRVRSLRNHIRKL
jgi:hypothetical protein